MKKKFLLVDDHELVTEGISRIILSHEGFEVAAQLGNGKDAVEFVKNNDVDFIIMDVNMPVMDGMEATLQIKKLKPGIKIIGLTMLSDFATVHKMLECGADGFLLKNTSSEEFFKAIEEVQSGKTYVNNSLQEMLLKGIRENKNLAQLTKKEKEVLKYIVDGLTSKEIAVKMFLGEETVKTHRKNIMSKFNIHNAAELVRFAMEHGII